MRKYVSSGDTIFNSGDKYGVPRIAFLFFALLFVTTPFLHADFTVVDATLTLSGSGAVFDSSGSIVINNAGVIDAGNSEIRLTGNWNNGGRFVQGTSTITFYDTGASSITSNTTFYSLTCMDAGKTIYFQNSTTQTINGALNLTGALGNEIKLRPTLSGTTWYLRLASSQTVQFTDVQNSSAMGKTITANSSIDSGGNNGLWIFPAVPNPPQGLSQAVGDFQTLSFGNWTAYQQIRATFTLTAPHPADTLKFNIQFSTYSDFSYNFINSTSPASATLAQGATNFLTPLLPEGTWYWRAMATDNNGNPGSYSSATVVNNRSFGVDVSSPTGHGISSVIYWASSFTLNLNQASDPYSGLHAQPYAIRYSTSSDFFVENSTDSGWFINASTWIGLSADTTYYVQTRARDVLLHVSSWTAGVVSTMSWVTLAGDPAASWTINIASITINWGAASPENPSATPYTVQISSTNFSGGTLYSSATLRSVGSAVFSGLSINTTYYGKILVDSWQSVRSTYSMTPNWRATMASVPGSASWSSVYTTSLTVTWGASSPDNASNTVYLAQVSNDVNFSAASIVSSSTVRSIGSAVILGLTANTSYYGRILAQNSESLGSTASIPSPQTVKVTSAAAPTAIAFTVSDITENSLTMNWSANGNPNGTRYEANVSTSSTFVPYSLNVTNLGVSITSTTLSNQTTYYFRVRAKSNEQAFTDWSATISTRTTSPAAINPPPSSILNLTAIMGNNAGEAALTWTAPGEDGMSGSISGGLYRIKYFDAPITNFDTQGTEFTTLSTNTVPGQAVGMVVTGLTPNVIYYFAVRTRDGNGNWSDWTVQNGANSANSIPARANQPSSTMYFRGDWNNWATLSMTKDTNNSEFHTVLPIAASNNNLQFKFDPSGNWSGDNYGQSGAVTTTDGQVSTTTFNGGFSNLKANINATQSCWIVSIATSVGTLNHTTSYALSRITGITLAGQGFTSPSISWSVSDPNDRMLQDADHYSLWYKDVNLAAGVQIQFKFAPNYTWTDPLSKGWSWGDSDNTVGPDQARGTAYLGGSRANLSYTPLRTAKYRITLNIFTGAYTIDPIDEIYIPPVLPQSPGSGFLSTQLISDVYPDKARYSPGNSVNLIVELMNNTGSVYAGTVTASVHQYNNELWRSGQWLSLSNGASLITTYTWTAPQTDFQGYRVEVQALSSTGTLVDRRGSAIDVSSDWIRFPRMGFVADYDDGESRQSIQDKMKTMTKHHLNTVLFYDWMWRHDTLVKRTNGVPDRTYVELFNRVLSTVTIDNKVSEAHNRNMTCQAYHLIMGARENYTDYGVSINWGLFTSTPGQLSTQDKMFFTGVNHTIYIMNPGDANWRNYITGQYKDALSTHSFDGFQFDQFGPLPDHWDINGNRVYDDQTYAGFLNNVKTDLQTVNSNVRIAFNNVVGYGQSAVAGSNVDVMYREVWNFGGDWEYNDMSTIIGNLRGSGKAAIIAAYMNYDEAKTNVGGYFNEPSVRLTDAEIAASGGTHMELGEGDAMLSNEYYPSRALSMGPSLKKATRRYYDFITEYENILTSTHVVGTSQNMTISGAPNAVNASQSNVWWLKKKTDDNNFEMVHLINILDNDVFWRNFANVPVTLNNIKVRYYPSTSSVTSVFLASPDENEGVPYYVPLSTGNDGNYYIELTIPQLEYWTMIVYRAGSDTTAPGAISDLAASAQGAGEIMLNWTAPGDDGTIGGVSGGLYRIRYSTVSQITNFDFPPPGYQQIDVPVGFAAGSPQNYLMHGLDPKSTYYFAIKTRDESGNWSTWNPAANTSDSKYAGSFKRLVDGSSDDWKGTAGSIINASVISEGEWIWTDKAGEERTDGADPDSDFDLREIRFTADTDYTYFMFRFATISSTDRVHISLSVDNDNVSGSGNTWNGDDSTANGSVGLGNEYAGFQLGAEKNVLIHGVGAGYPPQVEIYPDPQGGTGWGAPRGSWLVSINTTTAIVEARIPRGDLSLRDARSFRFAAGIYENNPGWANNVDTTRNIQPLSYNPDLLDTMSIMKIWDGNLNRNDAQNNRNAWWEDIEDSDIDFWVKLSMDADGALTNTPPTTPAPTRPTNSGFTTNLRPTLIWNASTDPDQGDNVTSYLVEFASNSADVGTSLALYRVNVSSLQPILTWAVPQNLTVDQAYYWRVTARDRSGALSVPSAVQSFTVRRPIPFTPVVDSLKDDDWEQKAKTESSDFSQSPGNYARSLYVTNDAANLYVGWEAQGDPWDDSLPAVYSFAFDTDGSTPGVATEPSTTTATIGWTNKPDAWVKGTIVTGSDSFGSMTLYKSTGSAWDTGTSLKDGTDFKVSLTNGWGEFKIPLKTLNLVTGNTIQMALIFHPSSAKPGVSDSTPFDNVGTNAYGNNNSSINEFMSYVIAYTTMSALHIPVTIPIVGQGTMRNPMVPDSRQTVSVRISVTPGKIYDNGEVRYSTGSIWNTTNSVTFGAASFSGDSEYRTAVVPAFPKNTVVKYYVRAAANGMDTYLYGPTDSVAAVSSVSVSAADNAWSYIVKNASPNAAASVVLSPANPSDGDPLYCSASGASDPDGDPVTYLFNWYRNGLLFASTAQTTSISTRPASDTSVGNQWFCTAQSSDTGGLVSAISTSNAVAILNQVWVGTANAMVNVSTISGNEFIITDKTGDTVYSNADLKEIRIKFDANTAYFLFKLNAITSVNSPFIAVTIDTDALSVSGSTTVGDDSALTLGTAYSTAAGISTGYQARWERQLILHSTTTAPGSFAVEISSNGNWVTPAPSVSSTSIYPQAGTIEAQIPRNDLGLSGAFTARFSVAAFLNTAGSAASAATSPGNAQDSISIVRITTGTANGAYTNDPSNDISAGAEDLSDQMLDYWFEVAADASGNLTDTPPPAPYDPYPINGGTTNFLAPTLSWNQTISGSGFDVTSFLLELNNSSSLDGSVLWRVNVSTNHFTVPTNLAGSTTYYWRVWSRNRKGVVAPSTQTWSFFVNAEEPFASTPRDNNHPNNVDNYGQVTGIEDADGTVTWTWAPAVISSYAATNYIIDISSRTDFSSYLSSDTGVQLNATFTGLTKGEIWYARLKAKNSLNITGPYSAISDGIYVNRKQVNGDNSDWTGAYGASSNTLTVSQGDMLWRDAVGDQRPDQGSSSQLDLASFSVTADKYNLYFYFAFASTVSAGFDGRNYMQILVDNDQKSRERVMRGRGVRDEDSYVSGEVPWEYLIEVVSGIDSVRVENDLFMNRKYGAFSKNNTSYYYEVAVPLSALGGAEKFLGQNVRFTVANFLNGGGTDGSIGDWNTAVTNSNIVDCITNATSTWAEVSDRAVDSYLSVTFNSDGSLSTASLKTPPFSSLPATPEAAVSGISPGPVSALDYILYNIFIDAFEDGDPSNDQLWDSYGGDFQGVINKAQYLNDLGINMAYFAPPTQFGGGIWGFNIDDAYKHASKFGGTSMFIQMVKELHNRNIKVMIDWVCGQVASQNSPTAQKNPPEYFGQELFGWGTKQEFSEVRSYWLNNMVWYFSMADAFRYDNPKFWDAGGFGEEAYDFNRALRKISDRWDPQFFLMGEVPDNVSEVNNFTGNNGPMIHGGLDMKSGGYKDDNRGSSHICNWSRTGSETTVNLRTDLDNQQINWKNQWSKNVIMMENHDEKRFISRTGATTYRCQLGYFTAFMVSGSADLMYGGEKALEGPYDGDAKIALKGGIGGNVQKMPWDRNLDIEPFFKRFIHAKANFRALRGDPKEGGRSWYTGGQYDNEVLVFARTWGTTDKVIVMANRSNNSVTLTNVGTGEANTKYKDWLTDTVYTTDASGNIGSITVNSNYGRVLIRGTVGDPNAADPYDWASVTGTVTDSNGRAIANAIVDIDQKSNWTATTDANGYYSISGNLKKVLTGSHTMRAWAMGYNIISTSVVVGVNPLNNNVSFSVDSGNSLTFDNAAPAAPSGVSVKPRNQAATLSWTPNTENDFQSYLIYRSVSANDKKPQQIFEVFKPFYYDNNLDDKLTNGVTYYYWVRAQDRNGNKSPLSNPIAVMPRPLKVRFWLDARSQNPASASIRGGALAFNKTYWGTVALNSNGDGTFERTFDFDDTEFIEYKYSIPGTDYEFGSGSNRGELMDDAIPDIEVFDEDGQGNMTIVDVWGVYGDTNPIAPTNVTLTPANAQMLVGWKKNAEPDVSYYSIDRSPDNNTFTKIADVGSSVLTYRDTGLTNGTTYYYRVRAADRKGYTSPNSTTVSSWPRLTDTTAPSVPTGLQLFSLSSTTIRVSWNPSPEADTVGYLVYRSTTANDGNPIRVNTLLVPQSDTPYLDNSSLVPGVTYYFKVKAQDESVNLSTFTSEAAAMLLLYTFRVDVGGINSVTSVSMTGPQRPFSQSVAMSLESGSSSVWSVVTAQIAGKDVQYKYQVISGTKVITEQDFPTSSKNRELTIGFNGNVTITNDWEESPDAPQNVTAYSDDGAAWIYWDGVATSEDVIGYRIYSTTGGVFSPIVSAGPCKVLNLNDGQTYNFVVRSVDGGDQVLESANSNSVQVTISTSKVYVIFKSERPKDEYEQERSRREKSG